MNGAPRTSGGAPDPGPATTDLPASAYQLKQHDGTAPAPATAEVDTYLVCLPAPVRAFAAALDIRLLVLLLALLPVDHEIAVSVRLVVQIDDERRRLQRGDPDLVDPRTQVGLQIHGGDRQFWRRWASNRVPFDELQRRRGLRRDAPGTGWVVA